MATVVTGPTLKQRLARAERVNRLKSQALILPLLLFLLLTFLVPIGALLYKSVSNPEVVSALPRTVEAIGTWDGKALPAEPVYKALALDLADARKNQTIGDLSKRLNMELAGYRSLMARPRVRCRSRANRAPTRTPWKGSTSAGATRPTGRPFAATPRT